VGRNGKINGEVHAKKLIIQGLIEGSAEADRIEIHAEGKMSGSVTSSELVIEAQAIFEGESHFKARPAIENKKGSTPKKKVEELPEKASKEKTA
jgi:cytoskeletal protein CcmA (bactofilin family)